MAQPHSVSQTPRAYLSRSDLMIAAVAGGLYLVIIVLGITSELALRGPLIDLADAERTLRAILSDLPRLRLSIAADLVMALADVGLAVLLFILFRPVSPGLALAAMIFRLVQAVLIASNLMSLQAAVLLTTGAQDMAGLLPEQAAGISMLFLNLHGHGYDLGLVFFGINSLISGLLIWRAGFISGVFGLGLFAAGGVYLLGSALRFFAPDMVAIFAPAYGICVIAETAFCLWLLSAGWKLMRATAQPQG